MFKNNSLTDHSLYGHIIIFTTNFPLLNSDVIYILFTASSQCCDEQAFL